jgi:hypothetical protein
MIVACNSSFDLFFGIQIDRKLAGEKVEHTFVINALDFSLKFDECTRKNRTKVISVKFSSYWI